MLLYIFEVGLIFLPKKLYQVIRSPFKYARKSANQRKISHKQFVVGDSDSSDDEGKTNREPWIMILNIFTVSDVITSETLNLRKKYSLGKIGRKETRHNLISKSDNLVLVPAKPQLESLESLEEEEVEDTEVSRKIISEKSLSFNSLQRDFQLGSAYY